MKKLKFPYIKCCEWLYQGALSAGILFLLYGFLQKELSEITVFPEEGGLLALITAAVFVVQLLLIWSGEKGYRLHVGLATLIINAVTGFLFIQQTENSAAFWCYVALEAVCIVTSLAVYAIRRFPVMMNLLIPTEVASLIILAVLEKPLPAWCVCIMLTAFLIFIAELITKERKEILGLLPLFATATLLLGLLPKNEKPMDWSWVNEACVAVREKAEMLSVDISYMLDGENRISFTGYGESAVLGGLLFDDSREQLHVTGGGTKNPLYLTGKVYEVYNGEEWQDTPYDEVEQEDLLRAVNQSVFAERRKELTSSCLITMEYRFIKTADFFHELNTTNLYGDIPEFKEDSPWTMKKPQEKDFSYQLRFTEYNQNSDEIKAVMRQRAWKENAVWDSEAPDRKAEIYSVCTELPDNIPPRVYELAHTITADCDNDYDRMTAFAEYLNSYAYTKTPPATPDGQEFTDYFLFDSKRGYCTYFATAMAVLGRCEGIPTRYVSGFMTADSCTNSRMDIMITGENAHAWTEAYIERVGWVRFDGTPGFGDVRTTDRWETFESSGAGQTLNPYSPAGKPQEKPEEPEKQEKPAEWYAELLLKILSAVIAGCVLATAVIFLRNAVRRKKYSHADTAEKTRLQIKRLLRLGKLQGAPISDVETLQAYRERAQEILDTKEYSFAKACALYEGMRFGGKTVSAEELQRLEAYAEKAERCYLAKCGFLKKLVYRIT